MRGKLSHEQKELIRELFEEGKSITEISRITGINASIVYYHTHRDEILAKTREYYHTHRDKIKAKTREYYHTHRDEISAKTREYRHTHRDELRAKTREYYQNRPDVREKKLRLEVMDKLLSKREDLTEAEIKIAKPYLPILSYLNNTSYGKKFRDIRKQIHKENLRSMLVELRKLGLIEYREKRYWLTEEGENFYQLYKIIV